MLGHRGRIAVVDLTARRVDTSEIPDSVFLSIIGGRGLGTAILLRHGGDGEPLAPESPLCILVGPMTGTDFPLANRLTFVFRSPQTGTVAWANTGGYIAAELRNGGLDGIVVLGRAEGPVYPHVAGAEVTIRSARPLWARAPSRRPRHSRPRIRRRACSRSAPPARRWFRLPLSSTTSGAPAGCAMALARSGAPRG